MVLHTDDIDVSNDEAILVDGAAVGYVSSGGFAHWVKKSVALGYVPVELSTGGILVDVEINGTFFPAEILSEPLYDKDGRKMRS